ncbi:MAG: DUF1579 family protein [Gemmataceae bacterium]
MTRFVAPAVLAVAVCGTVAAQPPALPGPELDVLKKMVGTWDTTMKMEGTESKGTCVYKMDVGGLWLASAFETDLGGMKFSGRGYDSYDPSKKKYVGLWIDSMMPSVMTMEGSYDAAKKTMTMVGTAPGPDGKAEKMTAVSVMPDADTIDFKMYMGDAKAPAFTILYKRKK